ncbi:MAG: Sua5/YciO/YrdC/YwlC family protein, partial [Elusimicrobiota bacterium]
HQKKVVPNFESLVMTSGNFADEPICKDNGEARDRLGGIADYYLMNNRGIYTRCDDSIVRSIKVGNTEKMQLIRRARGYAPNPISLAVPKQYKSTGAVLSVGAGLKNTVCITRGNDAYVSQYIGDLFENKGFEFFRDTIAKLSDVLKVDPKTVVCDSHPDYLSSVYAVQRKIQNNNSKPEVKFVQHHIAHAGSVIAEHKLIPPLLCITFDGIGYGVNGELWGGEGFVYTQNSGFIRYAGLRTLMLPGGDKAVKEPWRIAAGMLYELNETGRKLPPGLKQQKARLPLIYRMIETGLNTYKTTSAGRIFDGISALLGVCTNVTYEAQAAVKLESLAWKVKHKKIVPYVFDLVRDNRLVVIDWHNVVKGILRDISKDVSPEIVAFKFHTAIAEAVLNISKLARKESGVRVITLSGGVFQNALLLELTVSILVNAGFKVYFNEQLPANDGAIAYGQAWAAGNGYVLKR